MAAEESGMSKELFEKADEKAGSSLLYTLSMNSYLLHGMAGVPDLPLNDKVFLIQSEMIRKVADKGPCVIVGRCADYVLREKKNLMRVYIYTSYENKYDNCVNNLSMTPREAKKMIRDVDQARIAYHMRYAGYMPDENKDIQIDSAFLGVEGTAWYLSQAAKHRFGVE